MIYKTNYHFCASNKTLDKSPPPPFSQSSIQNEIQQKKKDATNLLRKCHLGIEKLSFH